MSTLDIFRRDVEAVKTVAYQRYDVLAPAHEALRGRLASIHDNTTARENPVTLSEVFFFPEAHPWVDEMVLAQSIDEIQWVVPLKGWTALAPFNRVNVGRPRAIAMLEKIVQRLPDAINEREIQLILEIFRRNPIAVDGQNFFSTAHPKPDGTTFSNILEPAWADPQNPTTQELADLMEEVKTHFGKISVVKKEYADDDAISSNLHVIAHNDRHQTQFRRLREYSELDGMKNSLEGSFGLGRDFKPTAGQESWAEIVKLEDEMGPKPAIYVLDQDAMLGAYDENRVSNGFFGVGIEKIFGVKPGVPNTTIQIRPQAA